MKRFWVVVLLAGLCLPAFAQSNVIDGQEMIQSHLIPTATNAYSIGTAARKWKDLFATTLTDGTTSISGGNYTGIGNISGDDIDINAGTGDYTSTGTLTVGGTGQSAIKEGLVVNDNSGGDADDDFRVETDNEDQAFVVDASADLMRMGDFDTNYVQVTTGGVMTFVGTGDINLPDDSVDDSDLNYAGLADLQAGGEVIDDSHNHVITNIDSFTKANLETQTSDVSDYAEANGDTWTGSHDFSGVTLTGNIKKRVYISAASGVPRTTGGCADAAQTEVGAQLLNYMSCDFDASTDEHWQAHFTLPENYDGGTFTTAVSWTCTADAAKGVAWFIQLLGVDNDDAMGGTAFGTAVEMNDDGTTTGDYLLTAESAAITENNEDGSGVSVGGDELWIQLYRDVSDADDDLTTDGKLLGIWLTFGIDAFSTED